jgi:nucleotide-binding universal stress UspA family protein
MYHHLLVPVDGSASSVRAAAVAADLARQWDADVVVLHVVSIPQSLVVVAGLDQHLVEEYVEQLGADALAGALDVFNAASVGAEVKIETGAPAETILFEAERLGADLVVMGKRGLGQVRGLLLGSVSDRVGHHLKVPLLLIP